MISDNIELNRHRTDAASHKDIWRLTRISLVHLHKAITVDFIQLMFIQTLRSTLNMNCKACLKTRHITYSLTHTNTIKRILLSEGREIPDHDHKQHNWNHFQAFIIGNNMMQTRVLSCTRAGVSLRIIQSIQKVNRNCSLFPGMFILNGFLIGWVWQHCQANSFSLFE